MHLPSFPRPTYSPAIHHHPKPPQCTPTPTPTHIGPRPNYQRPPYCPPRQPTHPTYRPSHQQPLPLPPPLYVTIAIHYHPHSHTNFPLHFTSLLLSPKLQIRRQLPHFSRHHSHFFRTDHPLPAPLSRLNTPSYHVHPPHLLHQPPTPTQPPACPRLPPSPRSASPPNSTTPNPARHNSRPPRHPPATILTQRGSRHGCASQSREDEVP